MPADPTALLRSRLSARFAAISPPMRGALLMTGAALGFSCMIVLIRAASSELNPLQIGFFRNFFALLFMLPWLYKAGLAGLRTERLFLHFGRAAIGMAAMTCWFFAVALLPLAQAVSLNFTVPLFATAGAALILRERVRLRRWSATIAGFLGVLVIVQPGFAEVSPATGLPILAAVFMASAALIIKTLSSSENPNAVVFYMNLFLTPMSLVPALFVWRWPSGDILAMMILVGLLAVISHSMLTRAYVQADASAVIPYLYAQLPFVAGLGFLAFGEVPDEWTVLGAVIIAGSAVYIARREAKVAKEARRTEPAG